jgi:hypothetical protein
MWTLRRSWPGFEVMTVAEPHLPEPMTPHRAETLATRWRLAAVVVLAVGTVLAIAEVPYALPAALVLVAVCLLERRECQGWLDGYRAARREELDRQAGGLR